MYLQYLSCDVGDPYVPTVTARALPTSQKYDIRQEVLQHNKEIRPSPLQDAFRRHSEVSWVSLGLPFEHRDSFSNAPDAIIDDTVTDSTDAISVDTIASITNTGPNVAIANFTDAAAQT